MQEELVAKLHQEEMIDFLLSLAASSNDIEYRPWNILLLEIFYLIFEARPIECLLRDQISVQKENLQNLLVKEKLSK
jgi:replication fork protection complex subunit Tof1/Swi1